MGGPVGPPSFFQAILTQLPLHRVSAYKVQARLGRLLALYTKSKV